eukprot:CAMPEP_0197024446 /NCGR_PEP_ID=MMETSP1384-20130603/4983_1 /TAXON_ID=29189 /ORGANISM="Ammonia sp." /LENGTH=484 /DNA_ID=CAMNT_0042452829 /DNA_START=260 /DNA_END=1714 /DNA_ORIENTATION=-
MHGASTLYQIDAINEDQQYYQCITVDSTDSAAVVHQMYLDFDQLNHVTLTYANPPNPQPTAHANDIDDDYKAPQEEENKLDPDSTEQDEQQLESEQIDGGRTTIYTLTSNENQDYENLAKHLPYFADFMLRREKSVLNQNEYIDNPTGFLRAIRDKYNIRHPRQFDVHNDDEDYAHLRPWIEGKMEKLMAESGYFGAEKWKTRLFRLFDEALVWFDDEPSFLKKLLNRASNSRHSQLTKTRNSRKTSDQIAEVDENKEDDNLYMTPFGVLPLAMITGLKTVDIEAMDGTVSEDELLRLELEIGDEGVIILKCSDFNQRIKWYECLHTAIFTVKRPLFTKDRDLWRIEEPKPVDTTADFAKQGNSVSLSFGGQSRQLTKGDVLKNSQRRKKKLHVRMGKSLAFKISDLKGNVLATPTPEVDANDKQIEMPDVLVMTEAYSNEQKDGQRKADTTTPIDRVPSLSQNNSQNDVVNNTSNKEHELKVL